MSDTLASYRKTTAVAVALSAALLTAAALAAGWHAPALAALTAILAVPPAAVAASGWVVIARARRLSNERPDLFTDLNSQYAEARIAAGAMRAGWLRRLLVRRLLGHDLVVGTRVRIKSLEAIKATLAADGTLDALPLMPEMVAFCGQEAIVFRCVDKIYDYKKSRRMRDLDRCVLLVGLRCDGSAHGGCQARCPLLWKVEWLERLDGEPKPSPMRQQPTAVAAGASLGSTSAITGDGTMAYRCQFTQLTAASRAQPRYGVRRWLRPLVAGNLAPSAFLVAVATRLFNWVQGLRGGTGYPPSFPRLGLTDAVLEEPLSAGHWVRVRSLEEIARTLNKDGKHRGLWFDPDMVKHCGQSYRVLARVDQIIDVVSGRMLRMKTPCIILDGVDYSGEFLQLSAQHEYLYWREAWLRRTSVPAA